MPGLIRRGFTIGRARDEGAVTSLVAVLLAGGVMMGMGAIVLDIGRLYGERAELQGGAEAAAFAVAQRCGRNPGDSCVGVAPDGTATDMAGRNATDGLSQALVCGNAPGLAACPPAKANLTRCAGTPPTALPYAEVRTSTLQTGGKTMLPPGFAAALLGDGYAGSAVGACARVKWGVPSSAKVLRLAISECAWRKYTADGTVYAPAPPYESPSDLPVSYERNVRLSEPGCTGLSLTGEFAWLDGAGGADGGSGGSGGCETTVEAGRSYSGQGANFLVNLFTSGSCKGELARSWFDRLASTRKPAILAVYGKPDLLGRKYPIVGFTAFIPTGYNLSTIIFRRSWLSDRYCGLLLLGGTLNPCVSGAFVKTAFPGRGRVASGPARDMGVRVIQLDG